MTHVPSVPADSSPNREISRRSLLQWSGAAGLAGMLATLLPPSTREAFAQLTETVGGSSFTPIRPPAAALAVRSMYLSTWSPSNNLAGTWPMFWNGHTTALTGIVRVDGTAYVFCGAPNGGYPLATQTAFTLTSTRSTYVQTAGPVTLTVAFLSPVDPDNLQRQCVPLSYLTVDAASNDGGSHSVSVYLDISGEWAHGDTSQQLTWAEQTVGNQLVLTSQPANPTVLGEYGDQASWGTVVWSTDNVAGTTWQTGADSVVRANGAAGSLPNTDDPNFRAINNNWPVFAPNRALGSVGPSGAQAVFVLGHVRTPAVSYLGTSYNAWWSKYWTGWQAMLTWFRNDLPAASEVCAATDNQVNAWATEAVGGGAVGDQYAAICALALRQAFAGTELINHNGTPWALLKEISSDGNVSTLDVIYPAFPAYLQLSPQYLQLLLAPIFDYVENHPYPKTWAPHDIGSGYPNATGHLNGSGEEDMPVEETANILIMTAALVQRLPAGAATAYVQAHYPILLQWAKYLVSALPDPGNQNQTDDFTGFIAHSSNLALKGIVGIAAMGQLAQLSGNTADATSYPATAKSYITTWLSSSQDGQHLRLAYDQPGTWSLKYNGFPDRLLNTNLVSPAVQAEEAAWYTSQAGGYGVLLDPRNDYTKADWEIWTAAFLQAQPAARNMLVADVYNFANVTANRVPLTDWYVVSSAAQRGFADRPVVGGLFSLQTLRYTANGLVGYWPLDGSTSYDNSGNFQDGVLNGGAGYTAGKQGGAISLNGTTACVSSQRPVVRTDGSFTITAWANLSSASTFRTVASQDGDQASGFFLQYSAADNRWAMAMASADVANAASTRALSSAAPAVGAWVHLAGVRDAAAGVIKLYVNGILQQNVAYSGSWQANGALQIGRGKWNGAPADFFAGAVDEVRAFDHALTDAEIAASADLTTGLVAGYGVDEGTGATTADAVNGHTLTLTNAGWGGGYAGPGLALNGTSGFASGVALVNTASSFSVSAWVSLTDATGFHTVASQDGASVSGFFLQYSGQDNAWAMAMLGSDSASAATARATSQFAPRVGDWTHLVGVRDTAAGQLRLYVNGRLAGTAACGAAWNASGSFTLGRGRFNAAPVDYFPGGIDQVRVWSRALSDADVRALV